MNSRALVITGLSVLVGLCVLFTMVGSSEAQQSAGKSSQIGRYQMAINSGAIVVHDTTTGECWFNDAKKWTALGTPTKVEK